MKILKPGLIVLVSTLFFLVVRCTTNPEVILKPRLFITLKDEAGNSVSGATIRLYKNEQDSGIVMTTDTTGYVIFRDLEPELYYWLARKGCSTNRNSQTTLDRALIPGVILYGYSVMSATGILKIVNTSGEPLSVSSSFFSITLNDTPYIAYPRVDSFFLVHHERLSAPGMGRDTTVPIRCGDTTFLVLP